MKCMKTKRKVFCTNYFSILFSVDWFRTREREKRPSVFLEENHVRNNKRSGPN